MTTPSQVAALIEAASEVRDAFDYDPGHSDLDNEQPIHISTTMGAWRKLDFALSVLQRGITEESIAALIEGERERG